MALDLFRLDGRCALVTGGGRGLGRAIAVALAQAGADVAVASRSPEATGVLAEIKSTGRRGAALAVDLHDSAQTRALVERAVDALGRVDILVNNSGIVRRAPALETSIEDWRAVLQVNLDAVWIVSQAAAQQMSATGGGKIINIASLLSFQGGIRVPAYTAAKHAVTGITKALANELAPLNINVNAIAPGYMVTDNTAALREDAERNRQISERIPAGRWGTPEDLAGAAVFLASRASDYVNGHVLVVDGGWMAR